MHVNKPHGYTSPNYWFPLTCLVVEQEIDKESIKIEIVSNVEKSEEDAAIYSSATMTVIAPKEKKKRRKCQKPSDHLTNFLSYQCKVLYQQ